MILAFWLRCYFSQQIFYNIRGGKKIEILVTIIIIKLIINMIINNILILLFLFILRLCFKIENLLDAQFGELEKCI